MQSSNMQQLPALLMSSSQWEEKGPLPALPKLPECKRNICRIRMCIFPIMPLPQNDAYKVI